MSYSRRDFGKLALAGLPAVAFLETPLFGAPLVQAKPNSLIKGIQIGIITYSYGGMPDQSAEATLRYVIDSNISAIELMDGPAEMFAGRPPAAPRGGGGGFAGGGGGGRVGAPGAPPAGAAGGVISLPVAPPAPGGRGAAPAGAPGGGGARGGGIPEGASFNGQPCASQGRGAGGGGGRAGGGRGGGVALTPEQIAEQQAAQQEAATKLKDWRGSVSMDKFKALRKMYNDAGVTVFAYKPDGLQKNMQTSDAEWNYVFSAAAALGATQLTMELPGGADAEAMLKRVAMFAEKHKVYAAYHTHAQGSMTAFDQALALSKSNMCAVDLGHYVAAGNVGGGPIEFLQKHHDRMLSFHLKERTLPEHCSLTLPFGMGDAQVKETLLAVQKNKWKLIPTIELEYPVPEGSDKVKEAKRSVDFCREVLGA